MKILITVLVTFAALFGADSLSGKWDFVWETPGGERRSTLVFEQTGDDLSVTFPESPKKITGSIKDGEVKLSGKLYSPEAGQEGDFRLEGKLADGKLAGRASWNEHGMTFKAARAAASE
jgi:hypothetical protein